MLRCNIRSNRSLNRFAFQIDYLFIKIAVKPRPSGRGCKAVTRKPPQGACLVPLMVTERSRSTESGLERLFAKKED